MLAGFVLAAVAPGDAATGEPHGFLRTVARFSPAELDALERGQPVAKVLDTDKREVAIAGAVRVKGPRGRLVDRYRDVSSLRGSNLVMEVGRFGASPRVEDLSALTFEDYDLGTIRDCRPGDCGVRLSAESMARFHQEVDWRAPDWRQQAGSLWRRLLVEYVSGYLASGTLAEYRNKEAPLSVAQEFGVLFDESRYLTPTAPELFGYLQGFPRAQLPGAEDILYWSKDNVGVRPVTSLTHLTLYNPPPGASPAGRPAVIVTRQIYATHYFDAGLGLTMAFDDNASGFYMVSVNRARTRSLASFTRGFIRSMVQRRSRDAMDHMLQSTKAAIEALAQQPTRPR